MKKLLWLIVLSSAALGAQVNDYFVNNPGWVCYHSASPWPCELEDSINYYISGDSVINTMTYKVLYKRGHRNEYSIALPDPNCMYNYTYQDTFPTGFLRSQGMQMYFIPNGDSVEYLLYDFNLTVGQQLPPTYLSASVTYTVTSIDSIYTAAGYRQRYFLNGNNFEYLIEGVGSSAGLLYPLGPLFEQYASLLCYSQNDTAWFPSQGPGCSIITTIAGPVNEPVSLQVLPNPASEYVSITTPGMILNSVVVYNGQGQIVKQQSTAEIYVGDLAPGIYFVRAENDSRIFTDELIIE